MKLLTSIDDFGAIDADSDSILLDCFEDHEAFKYLLNRKRFLVIGRKGSGKTSIYKKLLAKRDETFFSSGYGFNDYPWHYHDLQQKNGVPDDEKYLHSWKYLILLTLSKILLNEDQSVPYDSESIDEMKKIENFVIDTYGTKNPEITKLFQPDYELKLTANMQVDLGFWRAGGSAEKLLISSLPTIVTEVNANLMKSLLRCLNPKHEYYICFDQLDLGFDPSSEDYAKRLIGLILASRDINLVARENNKKLFICVFLRNDIGKLQVQIEHRYNQETLSIA